MSHAAVLVVIASTLCGQTDGEKVFKEWADLGAGGVWTTTSPEGDKMEHTYTWTLDDRFLQIDRRGGENQGISLVGVDPATGKVTFWGFNENGRRGQYVLTKKKEDVWAFEGQSDGPDGKTVGAYQVAKVDDNTIKTEVIKETKSGVAQEPREQTWTRQEKATLASQEKAPKLCDELKEIAWWCGDFILEGKSPLGDVLAGQTSCQPGLAGRFLCYRGTTVTGDQDVLRGRTFAGVDPSSVDKKLIKGWEFLSNGYVGAFSVSDEGKKFKGSGTYADGKTIDFEGILAQDPGGTLDYRSKARMSTGENVDYEFHWRPRPMGK
ncbi:MAG: hypothetical protein H8E44_40445 [Planctomycetes bacterium]|nr:hypothetical protein [Planctomycetota bacterium]